MLRTRFLLLVLVTLVATWPFQAVFALSSVDDPVESSTTCDPTTSTPSSPPIDTYDGIRFSSLLPDPVDDDRLHEEIVLENTSLQTVDVSHLQISDKTRTYVIPQGISLPPQGTHRFLSKETRISLNNTGEELLTLSTPDNILLDKVLYHGTTMGDRLIRLAEGWTWESSLHAPPPTPDTPKEPHSTPTTPDSVRIPAAPSHETPSTPPVSIHLPSIRTHVRISEIFPAPEDDALREWIELSNTSDHALTLTGLILDDIAAGGSAPYILPEETRVPAHGFLVLERSETGISLNNTGDHVRLLDPKETVLHEVVYGNATRGKSYASLEHEWHWSDPTPGEPPLTLRPSSDIETTESLDHSSSVVDSETSIQDTEAAQDRIDPSFVLPTIQDIRSKEDDTQVHLQGIISVEPHTVLSNGFVLQDDTGGLQVIASSTTETFPPLPIGTLVEVEGVMDTYRSARAVRPTFVQLLGHSASPEPIVVPLEELDASYAGRLIETSGFLLEKKGSTILIESTHATLPITARERTHVSFTGIKTGSELRIAGVLLETSSGIRLYPRTQQDIQPITQPTEQDLPTDTTPTAEQTSQSSSSIFPTAHALEAVASNSHWTNTDIAIAILVGALFLGIGGFRLWSRHNIALRNFWRRIFLRYNTRFGGSERRCEDDVLTEDCDTPDVR